jgi:hypothetical protein
VETSQGFRTVIKKPKPKKIREKKFIPAHADYALSDTVSSNPESDSFIEEVIIELPD